ncbi:gastrula zinc finger protein XlCGF49.1-like [Pseudorasbora parva]|uniref:gastrula zinc finger protein XlCGF49.1-like n=1 Tax=Pseudorasbora parva TaxID=51549 RepID=UPI00351E747F
MRNTWYTGLMVLKEGSEVLNEMEEKDQFKNNYFLMVEKSFSSSQPEKTPKSGKKKGTRSHCTCQQCGNSFTLKSSLNRHMRVHTREKPYTCLQCGIRFTQKGSLNRHIKIHTIEKPYTSPQCGKSFTKTLNLNRHMRLHTGEDLYTCPQCGQNFTLKQHFEDHMMIHTGEKPFTHTEM